jgi:CDP-4-dehydro-6-deoxyglucose reductase, E3
MPRPATPPRFQARLTASEQLTPSVRELRFVKEDGPIDFLPGQWVNLELPGKDSTTVLRAYSIASPPQASPEFELAITKVDGGVCSEYLHQLKPGSSLTAIGPQGFFTRSVEDKNPSLFIATGTGLTPLRSMFRAALSAGANEPLWLLLGVRHESDLLYREELEQLAEKYPNFKVFFTLSRADESWQGLRGYVQTHVKELWEQLNQTAPGSTGHVHICGLERMVKEVRNVLRKELELPRQQVHSERYD